MSKMLGLQTNSLSPIAKKYRGDDDDPHFVPDSPIIGRQTITLQEEGELKRICALVLAHVPHSDDMSDDPLAYIAAQIQEGKKAPQEPSVKQERNPDPVRNVETARTVTHQFLNVQGDSATPSDASHRDTFNATDYSTPLTSAGITPGETARRFSDAARKSLTGTKKPGSNLRNESNSQAVSTGVQSLEAHKHSTEAESIKRTLRLVTDGSSRPQSDNIKSMEQPQPRPIRFSMPADLNKSLPPPPPTELPTLEEEKQPHISRLMKTIRGKKSMPGEGRSFSTSSTPPMLSNEMPRTPYPRASTNQSSTQEPPRKRFRIPLFHRRQRPAAVLAT